MITTIQLKLPLQSWPIRDKKQRIFFFGIYQQKVDPPKAGRLFDFRHTKNSGPRVVEHF